MQRIFAITGGPVSRPYVYCTKILRRGRTLDGPLTCITHPKVL